MSKQLKRSLIFSSISGIILTFVSAFVPFKVPCCEGCMCDYGSSYGFPFPLSSGLFKFVRIKGLILDFFIYYVIAFVVILLIFIIINFIKRRSIR